jgi:hypothetical protein
MKAIIVLDNYPPYLTPCKLYEIKGQSQIDPNIYFVVTDDGSRTSVDISNLKFSDQIRNEKLESILVF